MVHTQDTTKLYIHNHNRSLSSLSATSEAATFYSAHAHHPSAMEMLQLSPASTPISQITSQSPKPTSPKMSRQDSGYADTASARTSTSSTRPSKPRRRRSTRDSVTRGGVMTQQSYIRTSRPGVQARHTSPTATTYQFYQFPSLPQPPSPPQNSSNLEPEVEIRPQPPPPTVQYWTSDSTRRLEYAAIDAASKGLRGFLVKLVPDCILPPESRSSRRVLFHEGEDDDDRGSVRRYRLVLPEEEKGCASVESKERRPSLLRKLTNFGRRASA